MTMLAVGVALLFAAGAAQAGEALKVGFVYVSPIGDAGWTYQHDLGRKAMEQALGNKVIDQVRGERARGRRRRAGHPRAGRRAATSSSSPPPSAT